MIKINIACVGSIKEKFYVDALNEYKKRLSRFCSLNVIEVSEETNLNNLEKKQEKESLRLLESSKGIIILLDREGKTVSSEKLAETIKDCQNLGQSEITFIIGGSNGVSKELKQKANYVFSFGAITFPHQLFRVVLVEQIYRAFTINAGMPYHK